MADYSTVAQTLAQAATMPQTTPMEKMQRLWALQQAQGQMPPTPQAPQLSSPQLQAQQAEAAYWARRMASDQAQYK